MAFVHEEATAAGPDHVTLWVVDLRTGRRKAGLFGGQGASVTSFRLKRNGSVAAIGAPGRVGSSGLYGPLEVRKVDKAGEQLLDIGDDIDPQSLALSRDRKTLSWIKGGLQRSTPIY